MQKSAVEVWRCRNCGWEGRVDAANPKPKCCAEPAHYLKRLGGY